MMRRATGAFLISFLLSCGWAAAQGSVSAANVTAVPDGSLPAAGSSCGSTLRVVMGMPSHRLLVCQDGTWSERELPLCSEFSGFAVGASCSSDPVCQDKDGGQICFCDAGSWACPSGGGGSGDITRVGDVASGDAFSATGAGTSLWFATGGAGKVRLTSSGLNVSSDQDVTLPDQTGQVPVFPQVPARALEGGSLVRERFSGYDFGAGFDLVDGDPVGVTLDLTEKPVHLDTGETTGICPVAKGGTGAGDAAGARANLGAASQADLDAHTSDTGNPHQVTAAQVGKDTAQWNADRLQGTPVGPDAPASGQVLKFDGTRWAPGTDEVGGHGDGTDCPVGQYARGVDANGNAQGCTTDDVGNDYLDDLSDNRLADLSDVDGASPGVDQVLKWNGAAWGPATDSTGNDSADDLSDNDLEDLGNVQGTPTDGQVLKWNATAGQWEPGTDLQGSGGGSLAVEEGDATVVSEASVLDFGAGFDVTEDPAGEANVVLDYTEDPVDLGTGEVTGTLPVANGGTGATTADAARSNLDVPGRHGSIEHIYTDEWNFHFLVTLGYDHTGLRFIDKAGLDQKDSIWRIYNSAGGLRFVPEGTADDYLYTVEFSMRSGTTFSIGQGIFACTDCINLSNDGLFTNTLSVTSGGTGGSTAPDDNLMLGNGSAWTRTAVPDCPSGKLTYDASANSFACGTDDTGNDSADDLSDNALDDLGDVSVGSPADGQCLKWDAGTSSWVPGDCGTGGGGGTSILWHFTLLDPSDTTRLRNCDGTNNTCLLGPRMPSAATISGGYCVVDPGDSGETVDVDLFDCDSSSGWSCTDVGGSSSVGNADTAITVPGSVAAGHRLAVDVNSAPSTVDQLECTIWGTLQ